MEQPRRTDMYYEVISYIIAIMYIVFMISLFGASVYLFILVVKALKKYINSKEVREEKRREEGSCEINRRSP